jgi:hypothetical protein
VRLPWSIRDRIFVRKLGIFLHAISTVPEDKRKKFSDQIDTDQEFMNHVGESVLLLLDRADDMKKPALYGRAFAAYLEGKITYEQLTRMTTGIDRALMYDIDQLSALTEKFTSESWGAGLMSAGLARLGVSAAIGSTHTLYLMNDIGMLVLEHCLNTNSDAGGRSSPAS